MADARRPSSGDQFSQILRKIDRTLAEGQTLREKVVKEMEERHKNPIWPERRRGIRKNRRTDLS
jgi:predicted ATP-dependent endonuclease of OLD family